MPEHHEWIGQPNSSGWWLWMEAGEYHPVKLLLSNGGRQVAYDYELAEVLGRPVGENENYWEGTDTTQEYMPGAWKKAADTGLLIDILGQAGEAFQARLDAYALSVAATGRMTIEDHPIDVGSILCVDSGRFNNGRHDAWIVTYADRWAIITDHPDADTLETFPGWRCSNRAECESLLRDRGFIEGAT
jgi:hypothetical protein